MSDALPFIHALQWDDLPEHVQAQAKRCLRDLIGVAAGGLGTDLSRIIRDHAAEDMPGAAPMPAPVKLASARGVSMTRFSPNSASSPAVTL